MINLPVLEFGDEGLYVYIMQAALKWWGYACDMTGRFDEHTLPQLRRFRKTHYINGDTICDAVTWKNLLDY